MKRVIKSDSELRNSFQTKKNNKINKYGEEDRNLILNNIERLEQTLKDEFSSRVDGIDVIIDSKSSNTGKQVWMEVKFFYDNRDCGSHEWLLNLDWFLDWDTLYKKVHKSQYYIDTIDLLDSAISQATVDETLESSDVCKIFKQLFDLDCDVHDPHLTIKRDWVSVNFSLSNYMDPPSQNILLDTIAMGTYYFINANPDYLFVDDFAGLTAREILERIPWSYDPHEVLDFLRDLISDISEILPGSVSMRVASNGGNTHCADFEFWRTENATPDFNSGVRIKSPIKHSIVWDDLPQKSSSFISQVESDIDELLSDSPVGYWERSAAANPDSWEAQYLRENHGIVFDETGRRISNQ